MSAASARGNEHGRGDRTTTSGAWSISSARCRTAIWAASARDIDADCRQPIASICRAELGLTDARADRNHAALPYIGLLAGLVFAIVLVYLLIVVNFQSWLDPFIIITALPAALAGIVLFLFVTHTTLSVPALMGAIMCMGVATANSILVVSFRQGTAGTARQMRSQAAHRGRASRVSARC